MGDTDDSDRKRSVLGIKFFVDEVNVEIPLIFKSIIDADRSQVLDLTNDGDEDARMARAASVSRVKVNLK